MISTQKKRQKILVVPLNWGLGHATRLIPILKLISNYPIDILVGGNPVQQRIIAEAIPGVQKVKFPYLKFSLSGKRNQLASIALQIPKFLFQIWHEHYALKKLVRQQAVDIILSDNCYGLWHSRVPSVFITHQLNIKLPASIAYLEGLVNQINHFFIRKYQICWIPDYQGNENLAGKLSVVPDSLRNCIYIGPLSRFRPDEKLTKHTDSAKKLLILISGPEKQRTYFEDKIRKQITGTPDDWSVKIVRGIPGSLEQNDLSWINHANDNLLQSLILEADFIICRAGYSTIMDLVTLRRTAILVPTPGQTEQEYLAKYLADKGLFKYQDENTLDITSCLKDFDATQMPLAHSSQENLLELAIKEFIEN